MKRFLGLGTLAAILALTPWSSAYVTYGPPPPKWGGGSPGTSSGGNIDWMFHEAGTPDMAGGPLTKDGEWTVLVNALQDWETATSGNLDLRYTGTTTLPSATGDANHIASWTESGWGFGSSAIGVCSFDYTGAVMTDADVAFNGENFTWTDTVLMRKVALHEFGHAIGFAHETDTVGGVPISAGGVPISIMYPSVSSLTDLQPDDVSGAVFLYGTGAGSDGIDEAAPPPPPPPPSEPAPQLPQEQPTRGGGTTPPPASGGSSKKKSSYTSDDDDDYGGGLKGKYRRYKDKYCVVATAAEGSENASRVDVLRAFRDRSLRGSATGSGAIGTYENAAAPVAQVVKKSEVLRALVRGALSR